MLFIWIMINWTVIFFSWHKSRHTNYTHNHNLPQWEEKSVVGTRLSFLHNQSKHTNEKKTQCLSHPENTRHLNVTAKAGQAFIGIDVKRRSLCDTPSVGEGQRGSTRTAARCEVHLCGRCCSIWTMRLWRRWISYRCLCQRGPIMNQMHM